MKQNKLMIAYGEPTDGFHHSVMNALYHLDDKRNVKYAKRRKCIRIAVAFAAVAAIGTTSVAAAATNCFGLFSQTVGKYGVEVTVDNNSTSSESYAERAKGVKIVAEYAPKGYEASGSDFSKSYRYDGEYYSDKWYYSMDVYEAKGYKQTEVNVIDTKETEFNGNKTIITTHKYSENSDKIYYCATEFFEDMGCVLQFRFASNAEGDSYSAPDYDEVIKIIEGTHLERTGDISYNSETGYTAKGAIAGYDTLEILSDSIDNKDYITVKPGEKTTVTVADKDGKEKTISVRIKSFKELEDKDNLSRDDFHNAGSSINLSDKYFDKDGKLIKTYTNTITDEAGDGIDSLGKTHEKTYNRHFYTADVEITANETIEDLNNILYLGAFGFKNGRLYMMDENDGEVNMIYSTAYYNSVKTEKDKPVTITVGLICDNDSVENARISLLTVNDKTKNSEVDLFELN